MNADEQVMGAANLVESAPRMEAHGLCRGWSLELLAVLDALECLTDLISFETAAF